LTDAGGERPKDERDRPEGDWARSLPGEGLGVEEEYGGAITSQVSLYIYSY